MRQVQIIEDHNQLSSIQAFPRKRSDGNKIKSGNLFLVQTVNRKTFRLPVHVQVYRNSFEHYAVVSENKICSKCTYLNLRNSFLFHKTSNTDTEIKIVSNDLEGMTIVLDTANRDEMSGWVKALESDCPAGSPKQMSSPVLSSPHRKLSNLQTLVESEEE